MKVETNFTVEEAAKKLRVSTRTILREIAKGNLKASRVGRRILITESNLETYLQKEGNDDLKSKIVSYLKNSQQEMVDLLQRMVSLPSVGYKQNQEELLADFITKKMQQLGIRNSILREKNAIAVRGSFGWASDGILIDCPLDTAPIGDIEKWSYPPFGAIVKGKKMYGRGTSDCKAGIVAAIYAVLALKKFVEEEKVRVEVIFDGGEQDGSYSGMEMVVKRGLHANAAIIGYAGDEFELAIGSRGYHRYTFKTHGRAAHTGSRYNLGVNAIEKMVKFINEMTQVKLPPSKSKFFPFGQKITFSLISGGREINVVPDECIARLDFRVTPDYSKKFVDELIERTIRKIEANDKDFKMEWGYDLGNEGYIVKENSKIVVSVNDSIKETYDTKAKIVATGPSNVGSILARNNIPAVIWGPRGGNVHSYDEYVEIETIPKTSIVYALAILKYFGIL